MLAPLLDFYLTIPVPTEISNLPFTQLCDIIGNFRYPDSYRLAAALVALNIAYTGKQTIKNFPPPWAINSSAWDSLIAQYETEVPDFGKFINQALSYTYSH